MSVPGNTSLAKPLFPFHAHTIGDGGGGEGRLGVCDRVVSGQ